MAKIAVDYGLCESNGVCVGIIPEVFDLDDQDSLLDEVYARLRAAVDRGTRDLASTRGLAERFWPVSADKPLERRPGAKGWLAFQVKRVLRKTMRWYVEPAFADQRIVNDALLRLVDDLSRRLDELENPSPR